MKRKEKKNKCNEKKRMEKQRKFKEKRKTKERKREENKKGKHWFTTKKLKERKSNAKNLKSKQGPTLYFYISSYLV